MHQSALNARRAALRQRANLVKGCHGHVTRKSRKQRAVCPSQLHRLFRRLTVENTVEES